MHLMQREGVDIKATLAHDGLVLHATDTDGQVYSVTRDDNDFLAGVMQLAKAMGWELI